MSSLAGAFDRSQLERCSKFFERGRRANVDPPRLSRKKIEEVVVDLSVQISEGYFDRTRELRCAQCHNVMIMLLRVMLDRSIDLLLRKLQVLRHSKIHVLRGELSPFAIAQRDRQNIQLRVEVCNRSQIDVPGSGARQRSHIDQTVAFPQSISIKVQQPPVECCCAR